MPSRLLIIRDPDSRLLDYINLDREDQEILLIHNAVYSDKLKSKKVKILEDDAKARNLNSGDRLVNYDGMLDAILATDKTICI